MQTSLRVFAGVAATVLLLAGCGSSSKNDSSGSSSGGSSSGNTFELSEFKVVAPTNALRAGRAVIGADNVGGEVHELVIVRAEGVSALPKKPDGSVDEDRIAAADKVGEIEDVAAGSSKSATFDLAAGKYVAFCNVTDNMTDSSSGMGHEGMGSGSGHIHFAEGMAVPFSVS